MLRHDVRRGLGQPVRYAEGVILRKVAVVEDQDEVAFPWPKPLNGMPPATRETPDVAGSEGVGRRLAAGMRHRRTTIA